MPKTFRKAGDRVLIQLLEADVDIGFGLVDETRACCESGQREFSSRALHNALEIVGDIERRLQQLNESEAKSFFPLLDELRKQIAAVQRESF